MKVLPVFIIYKIKGIFKSIKYLFKIKPVIWGNLRRLFPFSEIFGYDRGNQSVARYYIDKFIDKQAIDIHGDVLEIGDDTYITKYKSLISSYDILHVNGENPKANIIADLTNAFQVPDNKYDCIIMPQTIQFIYDFRAALKHTYRILKPGGVLLITLSGISQISQFDMSRWGEYWRFTSLSARQIFKEIFPEENFIVESNGNVLAAMSLLQGISSRELKKTELDFNDPNFEVIITIRAMK